MKTSYENVRIGFDIFYGKYSVSFPE